MATAVCANVQSYKLITFLQLFYKIYTKASKILRKNNLKLKRKYKILIFNVLCMMKLVILPKLL